MRKLCSGLIVLILLTANLTAQPKVFIAPMEEGFDSFLAAAMIDNAVPVTITIDECSAAYIITGQSVRGQNKWYDTVFGAERDRNQGSIKLLKVADKSVVWAGAAGDRSLWWGALKSGGQKKVANRLARELKKGYFNRILPNDAVQGQCTTPTISSSVGRPATGSEAAGNPTSTLRVTSKPDGADVSLNGKVVGNTPLSLSIRSGEWTVTVRKSGYRTWEKFVRLAPGGSLDLEALL
jgi:hypothetical protein